MINICTVILEYQNPQLTLATLASLQRAVIPDGYSNRIVIVDNSPVPDGTLVKALKKKRGIKLITTLQNTGFAKGNNTGINYGLKRGCQLFLLLNNDVRVGRNCLVYLIKAAEKGADLVNPKIYFAKGYEYHKSRYQAEDLGRVIWYAGGEFDWNNIYAKHIGMDVVDTGQFNRSREIEFANFCCILVKKTVFKKIGLLDERYFLYWEDGDFSVRAKQAGLHLLLEPKAIIWHKNSGSSGSGSQLHDYYLTRNRLFFGFKYARPRTKLALFKQSLWQLFTGRPGEKRGVLDYYLGRRGKGKLL
jgi:GT2 family glycosyltransferase